MSPPGDRGESHPPPFSLVYNFPASGRSDFSSCSSWGMRLPAAFCPPGGGWRAAPGGVRALHIKLSELNHSRQAASGGLFTARLLPAAKSLAQIALNCRQAASLPACRPTLSSNASRPAAPSPNGSGTCDFCPQSSSSSWNMSPGPNGTGSFNPPAFL